MESQNRKVVWIGTIIQSYWNGSMCRSLARVNLTSSLDPPPMNEWQKKNGVMFRFRCNVGFHKNNLPPPGATVRVEAPKSKDFPQGNILKAKIVCIESV